MSVIKTLSPEVAARIAAGEVVERPMSVVKELVENAIDAQATSIVVEVDDGGCARIAVTDNGCGMDRDDARRSIERHATSKITTDADLSSITTMGFRGEALYAISSVSRFVIETRTADVLEGTRVETDDGVNVDVCAAGCPTGTRIEVRELFFNTPARQKFLKSTTAEFGHINAELTRLALAHPSIAFELRHNGKQTWIYPAARDAALRMRIIASAEDQDHLIPIHEEGDGIRVSGWVGSEMLTRASPKDFHIFINRRPVRDRLLMHGITAGFGPALDRGRFPVAAVFIDIDPASVDVNVHPTKREVRFENGAAVHDFIQAAVRKTVGMSRTERTFGASCHSERSPAPYGVRAESRNTSSAPSLYSVGRNDSGVRPLGQLDKAFILCEDRDGTLLVIDQHAAHERLGYEELMREYREGRVERQQLLFPQTITLSSQEIAQLDRARELLEGAGFEIEPFGGNEILVKAVPAMLGDGDIKSLLEKIFAELESVGRSAVLDEKIGHVFSVIACHRQVRAGDALSIHEMQRLIDDIMREKIDSCPHGRPAVVRFARSDIDKWFKR